jgi:PAS domain S-box-containing protein
MNVVLISDDSKEAKILKSELTKAIPETRVDVCASVSASLSRLATPGMCDVVILDTCVPAAEAINLVSAIRKEKKPIGIIGLLGATEKEVPADLLKAGADNFAIKRPGYAAQVVEMIQQLKSRDRGDAASSSRRQVRLLYAGNFEMAQYQLSNVPQIKLERAPITPDGILQLTEFGAFQADALILESALTGTNTLKAVKDVGQKLPDVPIIVIADPGDEETAIYSLRAGAADCIARTGNYFHRMLLVLQKEIARRELIRERSALKSREERLRHIVESMPAGVTVIAPDGAFLAINDAGLRLVGATRLDQIVGKNIVDLIPNEDRQRVLNFLTTVCSGTGASIQLHWKGPEGPPVSIALRAVPMRRDAGGSTAALAVLNSEAESRGDQIAGDTKSILEKAAKEYDAKLREFQGKLKQQESAVRESESLRIAAEEQLAQLKGAAEEAATQYKRILEEHRVERENWEQARQGFQEQCAKIESVEQSLRSAQSNLLETHKTEQAEWELKRQELEQKQQTAEKQLAELSELLRKEHLQQDFLLLEVEQKTTLAEDYRAKLELALQSSEGNEAQRTAKEAALKEAESKIEQLIGAHNTELSRRDLGFQELEQKLEIVERQNASLESALQSESSLAKLAETYKSELQERDSVNQALEQKFQTVEAQVIALQTALQESESKLAKLTETKLSELSQRDSAYQELNQKCQVAETQATALQTALRESEAKLAQLTEAQLSEFSRRDSAYQELTQKRQVAETQAATLQTALQESEAKLAQLTEAQHSEFSRRDSAYQELNQKCQAAETQAAALHTALQESEAKLAQLTEVQLSEFSRRDSAYQELNQKCQAAETQAAALHTALQESEAKLAQLTEAQLSEFSQRDSAYQELTQRCQAAETQAAALQTALQESESKLAQLTESQLSELSQRDSAYQELNQKCQAAETQAAALQTALQESESKLAQLTEVQLSEFSRRDSAYQELNQKCQAAEAKATDLQSALGETEAKLAQLAEARNAELSLRDSAYRELDRQCQASEAQAVALKAALQESESKIAQLTEAQLSEISRRDATVQDLEQRLKSAEAQTLLLQSALNNAKSNLTEAADMHNAELSRRNTVYQELEQKFLDAESQITALKVAVHEARTSQEQLSEAHKSELSRRDAEFRELQEKLQASENQLQALQGDRTDLIEISAAHKAELAKKDQAQKELESKYQAIEKQRAALQSALHDMESGLGQINEKHSTEITQRDFAQKKAEQKYQAAEKQRLALEDALHDAQSSLAKLTETYQAEQTQWETARQELEQKWQAAEKQHATTMQNAAKETESRLAWISEQNQAKAAQLEKMQQELDQLNAAYGQITASTTDFHLRNQRLSRFTSIGVLLAKKDGQVLECNDAAARIFGYASAEEALSQTGANPFKIYAFEGALAARLQKDGRLENIEWSSLSQDGKLIRVQENATLVEGPAGSDMLVERILTDISKMHKLGEEVRRARRMESTGDLAAATVKSLKDVCASLAHSGELLVKSPKDIDAVQRLAEALLTDANRGVKHARQFLSVALKADRTPSLLNLNDILVKNDNLLHSLIGEDIDLQTVLTPRIGLVSSDHNEMVQLIGSLLASSREALPLGGTVTIETANIEIDSLAPGYPAGLRSGIYVQITFSADGISVQPERRTGANRTIVERMGGYLETANDPKLGNIYRVFLPRVEATAQQPSAALSNTADA